jgi:hypothetical protein
MIGQNQGMGKRFILATLFIFFIMQENKWEVGCYLFLGPQKNHKQYKVMISDYLVCNYMDFSSMMALS